jgi:FkbM family methyltransferase
LIRESAEIPVLCVEGDDALLPILRENAAALGAGVVVEASFVGPDQLRVDLGSASDVGRNANLTGAVSPSGAAVLRSLDSILRDHPEFSHAKLLKTDTEGFDFDIIKGSLGFIQRSKPAIFFEYDPHLRPDQPRSGIETIHALVDAGYSDFLYYDNFGNFLLHSDADRPSVFDDLDGYLASNRRHGVAVYYFDICALHGEDSGLAPEIKRATQ